MLFDKVVSPRIIRADTEPWHVRATQQNALPVKQNTDKSEKNRESAEAPKRMDDKVKFLILTKNILSRSYASGFVSGKYPRTSEEICVENGGKNEELAFSLSVRESEKASEEIDLDCELEFVEIAYEIAAESHAGIVRDSGKPYLSHPLSVAQIILEEFPNPTAFKVIVALLHDVIEDAKDPEVKKDELLSRFFFAIERKIAKLESESGAEPVGKKALEMISFAEAIVDAVDTLSKKDKEEYLRPWEKPFFLLENVVNEATAIATLPFLAWSDTRPEFPKIWKSVMKARADREYFSRFEKILINRLLAAVLYDKLADRLHNLREPKPDKSNPLEPDIVALRKLLDETEAHYLPLAERLDPQVFGLIKFEVDHWKRHLALREIRRKAVESVRAAVEKKKPKTHA